LRLIFHGRLKLSVSSYFTIFLGVTKAGKLRLIIGIRMMPPERTDLPEQILLARAIQGDADAFGDLYERYLEEIHRYVFYRVADRSEAEDLTETAFLKAWEALPRFKSSGVNLRAWLYRIAHNIVVDHYRARKATVDLYDEQVHDTHPLPEHQTQDRDEQQRLASAIRSLDDLMQQVIVCRFINGMSPAETAQVLGVKEGYVRVLQLRALQKLSGLLEKE
jgi:RNA polymerase sigma-70 factor (ECF subfamily)